MNARRIICSGATFVAMIFLIGCATTPERHRENAADALVGMRDDLMKTRVQIDKSLQSLNALMTAPPSKLKDTYNRFAEDVDAMTQESVHVKKESDKMRENSAAWLSQWSAQQSNIDNPELRKVSEERRAIVMSRVDNTAGAFRTARETLDPFVSNLRDIKQAVGTDLTPKGVAAVSSTEIVRNANDNGSTAARSIDTAISEFQPLLDALTPSTK